MSASKAISENCSITLAAGVSPRNPAFGKAPLPKRPNPNDESSNGVWKQQSYLVSYKNESLTGKIT